MPPIDAALDFDATSAPFNQFKDIKLLAKNRSGRESFENARHLLYIATDRKSHGNVLIKISARPGLIYQADLENEIASLLAINRLIPQSPYFPFVKAHGTVRDGRVYLISSFFDELPLANAIVNERIPARTETHIRTTMEVANALTELHGLRIYHLDLNPMNILLKLERGKPIIRIVDFESSYEWERHARGEFHNPPNTMGYSAPELSRQPPDAGADLFSLGAVLYTMLVGYSWTWDREAWKCVSDDKAIAPDLKAIVLKAVDPDPGKRYRSAEELRADLAVSLERSSRTKAH